MKECCANCQYFRLLNDFEITVDDEGYVIE